MPGIRVFNDAATKTWMAGINSGPDGNVFTLAHLSDPHLAPLPKPRWTELAGKRLTGYINWQRRRRFIHDSSVLSAIGADLKAQTVNHIAVTGDIANIALPAEFPRGRDWLDGLGSARDVTLVPGNHDIYVREAAALAARQWGAHMSDDSGQEGFPFVRRRGDVALIGLSSGVPTAPFLATGWLGTNQLAELAAVLNRLKQEAVFRVILIHHPPVSNAARHKRLLDAPVLKRVIAAHGADLLLHGHDHLHMLNWLAGPCPKLDKVREALEAIVADGHRAGAVIQRIRQLATKGHPQRVRLDTNELIRGVVPLVRTEVIKHQVSLRLALASVLPPALGDRVQIQQVIINLVINGIEAMAAVDDRPRELLIRSEGHAGDQVLVSVQDAGVGFDQRHTDRLFNAFFTTKPGGMGMGLSVSRSIIEGHGGRLWATPNPTHGATFHFTLPATS